MVLALWAAPAVRADISVRLTQETTSPFVHEPFTMLLEVITDAPPDTPKLPTVPDLAVTSVRRLPADSARRQHSFQIELIAERAGVLTLPPFAVRAGGERASTPPLRVRVSKPRLATEMSLAVAIEPTALRVGQPATLSVTWTSAASFVRCKRLLLEIPLLADGRCEAFPLEPSVPEAQRIGIPVNDVRVFAQAADLPDGRRSLSFRYKLIPRQPCRLATRPARLLTALLTEEPEMGFSPSHFHNHFFEPTGEGEAFEEVYLLAPVPELTVRDLAETGRKACFVNVVGPCAIRTSVAPEQMIVGQPALLTVHLSDLAFARQIAELPPAALDGLRPEFQLSGEAIRETVTDHTRSFTYILRPLFAGISRVPAVVIQTFDPAEDAYRTLRGDSIPITVNASEDGAGAFTPRSDSQPPVPSQGVRHNRLDEGTMGKIDDLLEFFGRLWWVFVPLAPLVWFALRPLIRRRERCRRDPSYARAMAAWRRYRRHARRDEESAWKDYLADRLGLNAAALTADTVTEALRQRDVDADLIGQVRRRFEQKDATDYGKRPASPLKTTRHLLRKLHKATIPLALLPLLLVPTSVSASDQCPGLWAASPRLWAVSPRLWAVSLTRPPGRPKVSRSTWGVLQAIVPGPWGGQETHPTTNESRQPSISVDTPASDRADELFSLAMRTRGEKPDEAQPLFVEAALRFESDKRFLNAGNSWFFAGASGRALANYRAAQRRMPFDTQLRQSVEFLRANRADSFPPVATPTGKLATAWSRYVEWVPSLRIGSFVLAYLLAWAVFLTAQWFGWRVRRALWCLLLAAVLAPLVSLAQSHFRPAEGVVIEDAVARLGPGYAYEPAFKRPLHQATEFQWLETRHGWVHARLPDNSEGWLRESGCMKVE